MTDPRLNHRAPRGRDGRARGERRDADRAMQIWAWWWLEQRERGWPFESLEARFMAYGPLRGATPAGSRAPNIDLARQGPKVHRLLLDMASEGLGPESLVLRLYAFAKGGQAQVATELGISRRTVIRRHLRGRGWLNEQLRMVPLELRQYGERRHESGSTWNNVPLAECFGVNPAP